SWLDAVGVGGRRHADGSGRVLYRLRAVDGTAQTALRNQLRADAVAAPMTTIGIIGAGHIGSNVAKAALAAGHTVILSNSRGPDTLTDLIAELGDGARAGTVEQAATDGEMVLVAIPLKDIGDIPAGPLE